VVVEYSDKVNRATIRMLWQSNSRTLQEVPLDRLYASSAASGPLPGSAVAAAATPNLFSTTAVAGATTDPLG
jgi:hypothetical protein